MLCLERVSKSGHSHKLLESKDNFFFKSEDHLSKVGTFLGTFESGTMFWISLKVKTLSNVLGNWEHV